MGCRPAEPEPAQLQEYPEERTQVGIPDSLAQKKGPRGPESLDVFRFWPSSAAVTACLPNIGQLGPVAAFLPKAATSLGGQFFSGRRTTRCVSRSSPSSIIPTWAASPSTSTTWQRYTTQPATPPSSLPRR